jgi:hypothetical protein
MKLEQALQIVKQALDQAVKIGVCANIDSAGILAQAWQIVIQSIKKDESTN